MNIESLYSSLKEIEIALQGLCQSKAVHVGAEINKKGLVLYLAKDIEINKKMEVFKSETVFPFTDLKNWNTSIVSIIGQFASQVLIEEAKLKQSKIITVPEFNKNFVSKKLQNGVTKINKLKK